MMFDETSLTDILSTLLHHPLKSEPREEAPWTALLRSPPGALPGLPESPEVELTKRPLSFTEQRSMSMESRLG